MLMMLMLVLVGQQRDIYREKDRQIPSMQLFFTGTLQGQGYTMMSSDCHQSDVHTFSSFHSSCEERTLVASLG